MDIRVPSVRVTDRYVTPHCTRQQETGQRRRGRHNKRRGSVADTTRDWAAWPIQHQRNRYTKHPGTLAHIYPSKLRVYVRFIGGYSNIYIQLRLSMLVYIVLKQ